MSQDPNNTEQNPFTADDQANETPQPVQPNVTPVEQPQAQATPVEQPAAQPQQVAQPEQPAQPQQQQRPKYGPWNPHPDYNPWGPIDEYGNRREKNPDAPWWANAYTWKSKEQQEAERRAAQQAAQQQQQQQWQQPQQPGQPQQPTDQNQWRQPQQPGNQQPYGQWNPQQWQQPQQPGQQNQQQWGQQPNQNYGWNQQPNQQQQQGFWGSSMKVHDPNTKLTLAQKAPWFALGFIGGFFGMIAVWLITSRWAPEVRRQATWATWIGFGIEVVIMLIFLNSDILFGTSFSQSATSATAGSATSTGGSSAFG